MSRKNLGIHKNHIFVFLFLLVLSIVLLILRNTPAILTSDRVGLEIASSITRPFAFIVERVNSFTNAVSQLQELQADYEGLLERLFEDESIIQNYDTIVQSNRVLEEVLEFTESIRYRNIPVRVIGKDPESLHSNWIVNKGIQHGVSSDLPVVAFQNGLVGLVGKVQEATWNSAIIRPILDPQSFIAGRLSRTRFEGLIQGQGGNSGQLIMEYLSRNARNQISVGDQVITSGLDSLYPADILVGEVTEISTDIYTSSLTLGLSSFIDFRQLEHVFILAEGNN